MGHKLDQDSDEGYEEGHADGVAGVTDESFPDTLQSVAGNVMNAGSLNFPKLLEDVVSNDVDPEECMQKQKLEQIVVHTFYLILDHFIQPLIHGIIHVVPFRDLTPFVFSVTYYHDMNTCLRPIFTVTLV